MERSGRLAARSGASQQQVAIPSLDVHAMAKGKELHLVGKTCAESDEGMNLVFVAYADFCVLAGSAAGQQDSVCVILEESHVFFVRISMVMPTGSIGLDGVQRTTMQIAVNDRQRVFTTKTQDLSQWTKSEQRNLHSLETGHPNHKENK